MFILVPLSDDYFDATDLVNPLTPPIVLATPTTDYLSDSEDSFESAPESVEEAVRWCMLLTTPINSTPLEEQPLSTSTLYILFVTC